MIQRYNHILYEGEYRTFSFEGNSEMADGEIVRFFRSRDKEYIVPEKQLIELMRKQRREIKW